MIPLEMRNLARCLLVYEADAGKTSGAMEPPTLRVYEKLRQSLSGFVGVAGFRSLAFRALMRAESEVPGLGAAQVAEDGSLQGLGEFDTQFDRIQGCAGEYLANEVGVILIGCLLGLLRIFLGEALTLTLLRDAWPADAFGDWNSGNGEKS